MSRLRTLLLGTAGFERATVWSAVGFALTYVAFDVAAFAGTPPAEWVGVAGAAVAALGAIALASVGGGALACVLLVYGPFAAVLIRTIDPRFSPTTPVEPLLVAVAAAVAVGFAGYLVGRVLTSLSASTNEPSSTDG